MSSSFGWRPSAKRVEMRSEGLRYFLLVDADDSDALCGFMSVMPTWEEGLPVLYCYELHLEPELRGSVTCFVVSLLMFSASDCCGVCGCRLGLGKYLMSLAVEMARRIDGVNRLMLTCFVSNEHGMEFYRRIGFALDESSPGPRELRDKVIMPDYVILSLEVQSDTTETSTMGVVV